MYERETEQLQKIIDDSSRIVFFRRSRRFDGERDPGFPQCGRDLPSEV